MADSLGTVNPSFNEALSTYNRDPAFTQIMWYVEPAGRSTAIAWQNLKSMQIYAQSFEVPSRTNEFGSVQYRAYEIPTPTVPKMTQDHSMTVNCDVQQKLRRMFLDCMNATIEADQIALGSPSFPADRRPTAGIGGQMLRLTLLAPDFQTPTEQYEFIGVRVAEVGTMSLSNTDGGIASFSVSFKSIYWKFGDTAAPLSVPAV